MYFIVVDFVDALSMPIHAVSQAEKRARQLRGMGIDENDIGDVQLTSARARIESCEGASAALSNTLVTQRTISMISMPQTPNATYTLERKDRRGPFLLLWLCKLISLCCFHINTAFLFICFSSYNFL